MKNTTIRPLPGYCLIEPIEDDITSAGGVYLPDSAKDKPSRGKVVEIGDVNKDWNDQWYMGGSKLKNFLNRDDVVVYKRWTNQEVKDEGKTYLIIPFSDLLAVIL